MVTVRQIEKLWKDESYGRLLRGLLAQRPEGSIRLEAELPITPVTAAAMAMIRLDELSQSHVAFYQKLLHRVLAKQEADGGWADPMTTALCLRALLCCSGDGTAITVGAEDDLVYLGSKASGRSLDQRYAAKWQQALFGAHAARFAAGEYDADDGPPPLTHRSCSCDGLPPVPRPGARRTRCIADPVLRG